MFSAGIVTYNPDVPRLLENVAAIRHQVDEIVIFDNGSSNIAEIESLADVHCIILKRLKNVGIATALNEICRYCESKGCEWVLTLDQDSVCPDNLIAEYMKYVSMEKIGIISPRIYDMNMGDIDETNVEDYSDVDACITSASLLNLKAWREVGGFWNELFIDMVDFDICWSLKERGYHIIRVNTVSLLHELGHSTLVSFRGNKVAVLNHSPQRYYYIMRNTIAVGRKHHRRWQCLRWIVKRLYLIIRYESDLIIKMHYCLCGLLDGFCGRLGNFYH